MCPCESTKRQPIGHHRPYPILQSPRASPLSLQEVPPFRRPPPWLLPSGSSIGASGFCDACPALAPLRDPLQFLTPVLAGFLRPTALRSTGWAQTSSHFGPLFSDSPSRLKSPLTLGVSMTSQQRILHSSDAINYATFVHQFLHTPCLSWRRRCFLADGFALPLFELANMHHAARKIDSQEGCRTVLKKEK